MHKRKTNKLWWIILFVFLLILGLGSLYVIGDENHPQTRSQTEPTSSSDRARNSNTGKTPSVKTTATQRTSSKSSSKNNSQNVSIPSEFWGTWYDGSKKYAVISANKFIMAASGTAITKNSLPLQLCNDQGPNGSYSIYHNPNPNAAGAEGGDGNSYWIGYLTIDGKKQRVLACYQRQGVFEIYTSQPTSSSQWISNTGKDYMDQIGKPDLDALKAKAESDTDNSADNTNNDDKQNDNSGENDSSNQTDMNDDSDTNSTDANQDNSDGSSQSGSNNDDDNSSSDVSSNSQDDLN
ncbi:hypothetical protein BGL34_05740 [Fructilactobacillus lindneri]|uniref:DUF4767 domain-containing protein n=2 Tax=Fructilactobacillus lindneri TaxID=53444 RepID=A0A0R2JSI3_9LACO|nr:hypothetical protein [Fructilactobacillus lindneri]ANZ57418.1 hypothetical protein AYR60_00765 [Fructilactobacillus lindneri]ANZ58685.1 hypothetical protein AYR59_00765 [Fructilactobacillus lindneri]KRN80030.1 hypothetical protein IV52_GL000148 [Fructilactobacillus lindneri DSM 20690 = JCM 11027]POG97903.1 hypothetical protein BGL31_05205 [Fructilactobacillus lindneri]POG99235.1 hypothetical protein BGL32_05230 [Fructilactobacillus lindneri]